MVHGHEIVLAYDAVVLREVFLRETRLVVLVGQFLAHEFRHPVVGGVVAVDTGDDERHCDRIEDSVSVLDLVMYRRGLTDSVLRVLS